MLPPNAAAPCRQHASSAARWARNLVLVQAANLQGEGGVRGNDVGFLSAGEQPGVGGGLGIDAAEPHPVDCACGHLQCAAARFRLRAGVRRAASKGDPERLRPRTGHHDAAHRPVDVGNERHGRTHVGGVERPRADVADILSHGEQHLHRRVRIAVCRDRFHRLDDGGDGRFVIGAEYARAVGVHRAVAEHRLHAGSGPHRIGVRAQQDRLLAGARSCARPVPDDVAVPVRTQPNPGALQLRPQGVDHRIFVGVIAVDAQDRQKSVQQPPGIDHHPFRVRRLAMWAWWWLPCQA